MTTLSEGNLQFIFNGTAQASKYDDWSFYRNQFQRVCGSSKAVDMICIENDTTWLIEIKDYRQHRRTKPIDLGKEVAIKVRDTLAGLVAARCNANDADEKAFANKALRNHRLKVVLHLEQPKMHSKLFPRVIDPASVKQKLKRLLKAIDSHPVIAEQNTITTNIAWSVTG